MMRSVLVPVDFARDDELVVSFAQGLGAYGVERVVLGHVIEASGMEGPVIAHAVDDARDKLLAAGQPLVDAGLTVECRVATGDPGSEIVALAAENSADSIIAGTHGSNAITRLLRGSLTEELVHQADRPTMLVRYAPIREKGDPAEVAEAFGRTIVLPTDFSASAMRALLWVLDLKRGSVGSLRIVNVLDKSFGGADFDRAKTAAEGQLASLCALATDVGVKTTCTVLHGDTVGEILAEVNRSGATGIVTGSHGRGALGDAVMGSTSLSLIRQAPLPVMIVP